MEDINDMREFEQRMLQRAVRRRMLLSTVATTPPPTPPPSPPLPLEIQSVEPQQLSPQRQSRRARLALLSGRINEYLKEEEVSTACDGKSIESNCNLTTKNVEQAAKPTNVLPKKKIIKTNANESTIKKSLPNNELSVPNVSDKSLSGLKVSVAQRRALFEPNIVAPKSSKTSTTVTITLTKTTAAATDTISTTSEVKSDASILNKVTTPPRPIPYSASTPPSRRGTRPRISPAIAASSSSSSHSDLSTQKRQVWSPPCIKNVLLKKKLIDELEDDQMSNDNDTISKEMATSSPINNVVAVSPADRIAMSVERVHIMSPPPHGRLYPDLSLVEDNKNEHNTSNTQLENLVTGCKRRSNGSSALNTSTASSKSVSKDDGNSDIIGAKRSRCESNLMDSDKINVTANREECSPRLASILSPNTQDCDLSTSMLSDFTSDSPMTQASTSFLYYGANGNRAVTEYLEPQSYNNHDNNGLKSEKQEISNKNVELDDAQSTNRTSYNGNVKSSLIHTVSTYRKQQQQLRINGTPNKAERLELNDKNEKNTQYTLPQKQLKFLNEEDENDDEYELQELEMVAARARDLERIVVPEQDRIIEQATQALNICDIYRQKSNNRSMMSNNFSPEHVHAERLLLIAGLKRTDAVREAQRLRVERTLLPGRNTNGRFNHLKVCGEGKTLVIESLRVPILSALISGGSNKTKYTSNEGTENLTRWPGGYRYFVCVVRAAATAYRPPMTAATRPADSVEESMSRFSLDSVHRGDDGIGYGYVEFITKKQIKSSNSRKCPMPTESEGAPIMIKGLDNGGWKITVELYGLSPTSTGEHDLHNNYSNSKEHEVPENNKSVLDKLWSTVTTPSKESKKHHTIATAACIESPGGPMAVRNTVFRQLGYFVFSDGQVDRQQFTLNKVHQSGSSASTSRGITITPTEETVRIHMRLLEDGEQYVFENEEGEINFEHLSLSNNKYASNVVAAVKKPLTLPSCKRTEGFLTLFDDHELRATPLIGQGQQWQRRRNIGSSSSGGTTSWRRLWFRVETVNNIDQEIKNSDGDLSTKQQQLNDNHVLKKTIVLRYWMYPEHAEQEREPLGAIDLSLCLPKATPKIETSAANSELSQQPAPAAPAPADLCARPNTLRLLFSRTTDDDNQDSLGDPLLLAADTADERRDWCDTVNAAVHAIGEYHELIKVAEEAQLKQKEQIQQKRRLNEQQRTSAWPTTPNGSGKSYSKKKKFYK